MMISEMRALVVDDEESLRYLCPQILLRIGFDEENITVVKNGREAQEALDKTVFEIVVSDYNYKTPPFDGLELLKRIRAGQCLEENAEVPFVLMTSELYSTVKEVLELLPPSAYIPKPFKLEQYIAQINTMLAI